MINSNSLNFSIAAFVTFHYVENRIKYVVQTIKSIDSITSAEKTVFVYVNDIDFDKIGLLKSSINEADISASVEIKICKDLEHPFLLTWAHKADLKQALLAPGSKYTHFIYVEDDEAITDENFKYITTYMEPLKERGLIPGLHRYEFNTANEMVSTDQTAKIDLTGKPYVKIGNVAFVELNIPYMGCFVLDRDLAAEYVKSLSFDLIKSTIIGPWPSRERATQGLIFERPPYPFTYRAVFPIDRETLVPLAEGAIHHLPNNYGHNPDALFGTVRFEEIFEGKLTHPNIFMNTSKYILKRLAIYAGIFRKSIVNIFVSRQAAMKI